MMHGRLCGVTIPSHTRGNGRVPLYTHTWMNMFTLFDRQIDRPTDKPRKVASMYQNAFNSFMIKLTTVHALCIDNQESGSKSHRSSAISYVNNHWVISFIKLVALKDRVFFIPYV